VLHVEQHAHAPEEQDDRTEEAQRRDGERELTDVEPVVAVVAHDNVLDEPKHQRHHGFHDDLPPFQLLAVTENTITEIGLVNICVYL